MQTPDPYQPPEPEEEDWLALQPRPARSLEDLSGLGVRLTWVAGLVLLAGYHATAAGLRSEIATLPPGEVPDAADRLDDVAHPITALQRLLEADGLSDVGWSLAYDTVSSEFGAALASAAARGHLVYAPATVPDAHRPTVP